MFSGLRVHPDREYLIYPLGSTVVLKRIKDGKQEFLHGHTNNVSCISVSKSGSYIASGQVNFMGFKVAAVMMLFLMSASYESLNPQMCSLFLYSRVDCIRNMDDLSQVPPTEQNEAKISEIQPLIIEFNKYLKPHS